VIHSELTFYKVVDIRFIFVAYECSVVLLEPFVERTIFSFWNDLSTFLKKQLALGGWFYFWTSFCFIDVSVFLPAEVDTSKPQITDEEAD